MTDAPVDLDELEARMCGTLTYAELRVFVAALIAELRAARAVSQEASELRAEVLTQVQAAMLTDAMRYPENGALHCRWCDGGIRDGHDGRCWYAEQCRRVDVAKALVDTLRKAPTPPADEVAGLLEDLDMVRGELRDYAFEHPSYRALDRIENYLKGKR